MGRFVGNGLPVVQHLFPKNIIESGEQPEKLIISETDQQLLSFGAVIAQNKGFVPDELYQPISDQYSDEEIVVFTAFARMMIATSIFNNVIEIEIDNI